MTSKRKRGHRRKSHYGRCGKKQKKKPSRTAETCVKRTLYAALSRKLTKTQRRAVVDAIEARVQFVSGAWRPATLAFNNHITQLFAGGANPSDAQLGQLFRQQFFKDLLVRDAQEGLLESMPQVRDNPMPGEPIPG